MLRAVFSLDPDSAPGPDGFGGAFWSSIIELDVTQAVTYFVHSGVLPANINSNFVVLIPKNKEASSIEQFRPIVLGNLIFKIITKIMATRLAEIAKALIFFRTISLDFW